VDIGIFVSTGTRMAIRVATANITATNVTFPMIEPIKDVCLNYKSVDSVDDCSYQATILLT
jgi:hypothetical protein